MPASRGLATRRRGGQTKRGVGANTRRGAPKDQGEGYPSAHRVWRAEAERLWPSAVIEGFGRWGVPTTGTHPVRVSVWHHRSDAGAAARMLDLGHPESAHKVTDLNEGVGLHDDEART